MKKHNILIVDDEELIRQMLAMGLKSESVIIFEAANGSEALQIIKQHSEIDLIITDYKMPVMNGIALTKAVAEYDPHLPVIFISAFDDKDKVLEALRLGALDFLQKPFEMDFLRNSVKRALERRELHKAQVNLIHLLQETLGIHQDENYNKLGPSERLEYMTELTTIVSIKLERLGR